MEQISIDKKTISEGFRTVAVYFERERIESAWYKAIANILKTIGYEHTVIQRYKTTKKCIRICSRTRAVRKKRNTNKNNNDDSGGDPPHTKITNNTLYESIKKLSNEITNLKSQIESLSNNNIDIINKDNKDGLPYLVMKCREDGLSDQEIYSILREKYKISKPQVGVLLYRSSNVVVQKTYLQCAKRIGQSIRKSQSATG